MGSAFSNRNNSQFYPVTVNDLVLKRVAAKKEPPPDDNKKCSTPTYCKIEETDIISLKKMLEMDEANTKKWNLTVENFNDTFSNFTENHSNVLRILAIPTFPEEREKIAQIFPEGTSDEKQDVSIEYKKAVEEELTKISQRFAQEYDAEKKAEAEKPPDPKKKK